MAHFAKVDKSSNTVLEVVVLGNEVMTDANGNEVEQLGVDYLNQYFTDEYHWVQTSYNTKLCQHVNGGTPFRKNYAGVGFTWDPIDNAFYPPCPEEGSILDRELGTWVRPNLRSVEIQSSQVEAGETPYNT